MKFWKDGSGRTRLIPGGPGAQVAIPSQLESRLRLTELAHFFEKQRLAMDLLKTHPYLLYGGAAFGGKSRFARWMSMIWVLWAFVFYGVRNAKSGLFCEDYPSLRDRQISEWDIPDDLGKIQQTKEDGLRFRLREEFGGGKVLLRNLDDPSKYDSVQFIGIAIDEWTRNPWIVFDQLRKRLRSPMVAGEPHLPCGGRCASLPVYRDGELVKEAQEVDCPILEHHKLPAWNFPFLKCTNPGGKSHAETKRVYVDTARGDWSNFPSELEPIKHLFAFVPSKVSDNPYAPRDYKRVNLDTLPEKMRRAYAEGSWDEFEGQYFAGYDKAKRKIEPWQIAELIKPWWPRWMSSDWGFDHWWITQWHTTGTVQPEEAAKVLGRIGADGQPLWKEPKQIVITYRELICNGKGGRAAPETLPEELRKRISAGVQLAERAVAELMVAATPESEREMIKFLFFSPEAFGERKHEFRNSIADEIGDVLTAAGLPRPTPADDGRINGWRFCAGIIDRDELYVSSRCPVALNTWPVLKHPDPMKGESGDPEDVLKTNDISDDSGDCSRYGYKSMLAPEKKPQSAELEELLAKKVTPHEKHMAHLAFMERHKHQGAAARSRGRKPKM